MPVVGLPMPACVCRPAFFRHINTDHYSQHVLASETTHSYCLWILYPPPLLLQALVVGLPKPASADPTRDAYYPDIAVGLPKLRSIILPLPRPITIALEATLVLV